MKKLWALFKVFRKGEAVANPEAWKYGQMTATMMVAFIMSIVEAAKQFGYELPVDTNVANVISPAPQTSTTSKLFNNASTLN